MAADALAPYVAKSATMVLINQNGPLYSTMNDVNYL